MKDFKHAMIDIETLGNQSRSAISQISVVEFDLETGETGREFDINVDIKDCVHQGLEMNVDTVMWWMKQSKEARAKFEETDRRSLDGALELLSNYITNSGIQNVWGNSARFDLGILSDAYNAVGREIPWDFWNELDVRTLVFFKPEVKDNCAFKGIPHNAIDDCKHQIRYCSLIWKLMNNV